MNNTKRLARSGVVLTLVVIVAAASLAAQTPVRYFYDDLGRISKVIDQSGNTSSYTYDAVGNILSITRTNVGTGNGLAILNFNPQNGPIGQTVTIQGQGFSTTASSDAVKFNGTPAAVTTATATALTVAVPSGATTGTISVTVAGSTATSDAKFTVTSGAIVSISVSPGTASIATGGQQQQFIATATYADGSQQNITSSVVWSSSNAAVAAVSNTAGSQGLATTLAGTGTTAITAASGTVRGTATLTVNPFTSMTVAPVTPTIFKGNTLQFTATGAFVDGTTQDATNLVLWSSNNPSSLTISNLPGSHGLASGVFTGSSFVCATGGGATGCTSVTVVPVLQSLAVNPATLSVPKGITQQFTAIGTYNDATTKDITASATWSSSNVAVATISNSAGTQGQTTDVGVGTTTISAALGSITNSAALTLTAAVPVSLTVTPAVASIKNGTTLQLTAKLVLTDGTNQDVTQTSTWSSSDTTIATASNASGSQGLVAAVAAGSATITATSGSFSNSASVTVSSSSASAVPRFIYATGLSRPIYEYTVNPTTGQLRSNGYDPGPGGTLTFDPAQKFLYAASSDQSGGGAVYGYTVNAVDGSIAAVPGSPFATGGPSAWSIATDPSGRFVYVGNRNANTLAGFSIDRASGILTPLPGSPFTLAGESWSVLVHPSGKFLFVTNYTQNVQGSVSVFSIDPASGVLTEISGSPFPTGFNPNSLAQDPAGKFLLVADSGQDFGSKLRPLNWPHNAEPEVAVQGDANSLNRYFAALNAFGQAGLHQDASFKKSGFASLLASMDAWSVLPFDDAAERGNSPRTSAPHLLPAFFQSGVTTRPAISVFAVDSMSGSLTEVPGSPFDGNEFAQLTVDPSGQFAYEIANSRIFGFAMDPATGALSALPDSPYSSENNAFPGTWDPSGKFLYVGAQSDIETYALNNASGTLTLASKTLGGGLSLAVSSGSTPVSYVPQFAYVASGGGPGANSVSAYTIDPATGALAAVSGSPFAEGLSPAALLTGPSALGKFLYVVNNCSEPTCAANPGSVSAYAMDPVTGALTPVGGSPFVAGFKPAGITIDPSHQFAYVINNQDSTVSIYAIDGASGVLTPLPGSPFATVSNGSAGEGIDPLGIRYLVAAKCLSCSNGALYIYGLFGPNIGRWAGLNQTFPLGPSPGSLAVDPAGNFAFVADSATNVVYAFSNITGFASSVSGSPFATGNGPVSIAVEPTGRFVYIANQGDSTVSAYSLDPVTGILTPLSGSPFATGVAPVSVTVDVSGKFLYVANNGDNTVSAYSIDPVSGALAPVTGSPFPTAATPVSVTTSGKFQ